MVRLISASKCFRDSQLVKSTFRPFEVTFKPFECCYDSLREILTTSVYGLLIYKMKALKCLKHTKAVVFIYSLYSGHEMALTCAPAVRFGQWRGSSTDGD